MRRISRIAYLVLACLFAVGILAQVFLVGLSLLGGRPSWSAHFGLGHTLGILPILMIILAYLGKAPRPLKPLTWVGFATYILLADVVVFLRGSLPFVAALHPVLAIVLFAVVATLAVRAWKLVREERTEPAAASLRPETQPSPETVTQ